MLLSPTVRLKADTEPLTAVQEPAVRVKLALSEKTEGKLTVTVTGPLEVTALKALALDLTGRVQLLVPAEKAREPSVDWAGMAREKRGTPEA